MKLARKLWCKVAVVALCLALGLFSTNVYAADEVTIKIVPDKTSASLGETITYTYTITNATSNNITNMSLVDSKLGPITLPKPTLASSGNFTVTKTHLITITDYPGPFVNAATVNGIATSNNVTATISASALASVNLNPYSTSIAVVKTSDRSTASVGDVITYTYIITNTSSVDLTNISLIDNKLGSIKLEAATLSPGSKVTAKKKYTVISSDLPGPISNIATGQGNDPLGNIISAKSNEVIVSLIVNQNPPTTKADILKNNGVPGKGIEHAPGLQKPFNPKSKAEEHAGKKNKN
jgi:hypothetical protein